MADVLEYKCPCCGGGLVFHEDTQKLTCPFCDNEFTIETIQALKESQQAGKDEFQWEAEEHENWADPDNVRVFLCSSCGGELITDGYRDGRPIGTQEFLLLDTVTWEYKGVKCL